MKWFLERISERSLPIRFGAKDKKEHPEDFDKLVQRSILQHTSNLEVIDCEFCDEPHECQVRNDKGKLSYVCDNGNGKRRLTDEELAIYEYNNDNLLKAIANELGLTLDTGSNKSKTIYQEGLYRLGTYENKEKAIKADAYYLRNQNAFEPTLQFLQTGNAPKVLITNTIRAEIIANIENLFTCILGDIILPTKDKNLFSKTAFIQCFDGVRRVRFDRKNGTLFLDNTLIYAAPIGGVEFHFLDYLWNNREKQLLHEDIYRYIVKKMGKKEFGRTAQNLSAKIKSDIKKECKKIDQIIRIPTVGYLMMADPLE